MTAGRPSAPSWPGGDWRTASDKRASGRVAVIELLLMESLRNGGRLAAKSSPTLAFAELQLQTASGPSSKSNELMNCLTKSLLLLALRRTAIREEQGLA